LVPFRLSHGTAVTTVTAITAISTVAIAIAGGALVVIDRRTWFVREAGPTRA